MHFRYELLTYHSVAAAEAVARERFKVRLRKCGFVIVVRLNEILSVEDNAAGHQRAPRGLGGWMCFCCLNDDDFVKGFKMIYLFLWIELIDDGEVVFVLGFFGNEFGNNVSVYGDFQFSYLHKLFIYCI